MINVTLKGGDIKTFEKGVTVLDVAKSISEGLARVTLAGLVNGEIADLRDTLENDCELNLLTFDDPQGQRAYRHTASHILAQAVKNLFPNAKLAIGPATDEGFYYDFDNNAPFTAEDVTAIEAEMKKIIKAGHEIERFTLPRAEALELMKDEPYKVELINELPEDAVISFYKQGDFTDLCAGPHLLNTKSVKAVALLNDGGSSGAYWRGSEKNKMLSRIYGTAFPKTADLEAYLHAREEARKRDHNKLGRELRYFTTSDVIGQGLPLMMPKGAKVLQVLQRFVEDTEESRGYVFTKTPFMAKSDLYKISGHWDLYRDGMFIMGNDEENAYALRPMTCPFQFSIYNAEQHSYRDLPIRYSETSTLFRNESSGEMHGLIRLRQFTISEAHLVCTKEQLEDEFFGVVDLVNFMMSSLGIQHDIKYRFSKWDENNQEKYVGDPETWKETQDIMRSMLQKLNIEFTEEAGEAAFYGPKLDIQFKNIYGKEDTIITVQIDFALAQRFNMTYVDKDGSKKHPIVIHRTSIGCYERTLAMLIEKYAGALPLWMAPVQVVILPISERFNDYAADIAKKLKAMNIRTECDFRAEKIGYKIRAARLERVPYMLVVGEQEAENKTVSVRSRLGDEGSVPVDDFIKQVTEESNTRSLRV